LFWQFINQVTTVEESKRFYSLFGLLGQTGLFLSGYFLTQLPNIGTYLIATYNLQSSLTLTSVQVVLLVVVLFGIIGMGFFWLLNNKVLAQDTKIVFKAKEQKIGLMESLKMIASSRYIRLIAIIMVCYGFAINLAEAPWKSQATKNYTEVEDFAAFVGNYLSYTGICTVTLVMLNSFIIRALGLFYAAIITPIVVLVTGLLFFTTSNFANVNLILANIFLISDPLMLVIVVGMIQNILSKSTKYTFFDITKEMSYVPLPNELKTKGKAAVEMISTKIGKSMSALLQSIVFIVIPTATYEFLSFYLMFIFAIICLVWMWAVRELAIEYREITSKPV
jgi:AAA family ATP:ADP antiporter